MRRALSWNGLLTTLLTVAIAGPALAAEDSGTKSTKPATDTVKPATETVKPATDTVKPATETAKPPPPVVPLGRRIVRSEREWQKRLTRSQFLVCRMKSTEAAFSGAYVHFDGFGVFECVACEAPVFSSEAKFDSGTGWPSFWGTVDSRRISTDVDNHGTESRIEVKCASCGSHLGHVFSDGPAPTGLRYCINSVALKFVDAATLADASKAKAVSAKAKAEPPPARDLEFR